VEYEVDGVRPKGRPHRVLNLLVILAMLPLLVIYQ